MRRVIILLECLTKWRVENRRTRPIRTTTNTNNNNISLFSLVLKAMSSNKTHFVILPSHRYQESGEGNIASKDRFYIAHKYQKVFRKDFCLGFPPFLGVHTHTHIYIYIYIFYTMCCLQRILYI